MDPAIELAPTPGPRASVAQVAIGLVGLAALTVLLWWGIDSVDRVAPGELVWPVPPDVWGGVVFVTAFLVLLALARFVARGGGTSASGRDRYRRGNPVDALVGGPIVLLIAVSATARVGVQVVGFAGLHPSDVPVAFRVVDTIHGTSRGGANYYRLRLRYGEAGREFSDPVGAAVYAAAREGDTVVLPVETGRWGLQRAMVATRLSPGDLRHPG